MTRTAEKDPQPPSPSSWLQRYAELIPRTGIVLDLASGRGRNARYLAGAGHSVLAVDIDADALSQLDDIANIETLKVDLEAGGWTLPGRSFAGIAVINYLHRPLLPHLADALEPNGVLIYDTFGEGNEEYGRPRNPDYLLGPGELVDVYHPRLKIVRYEFGVEYQPRPAVRARLCAMNTETPETGRRKRRTEP